jgi:hypothetical protein
METENLLPKEQKVCCSGTKMQRSNADLKSNTTRMQKKKNTAWIDYQKAFDRVPHRWIIKSLELIWINKKNYSIYLLEDTYAPTRRK